MKAKTTKKPSPSEIDEQLDAEIDAMAREILDVCNLRNAALTIAALSASLGHIIAAVLAGPELTPGMADNDRVIEAALRRGSKIAKFLHETRHTEVADCSVAG